MKKLLLLPFLLAACTSAFAQHDAAQHASHYASETDRAIKALSASDVEGLREGRGMGLARAAELNGYPGPMHVLELRDSLALTSDQVVATEAIRRAMLDEARSLGATLIEQEQALDDLFVGGQATTAAVDSLTARIAATQGSLRAAHLRAHVATHALLTPAQVAAYNRMRGYTTH